MCGLNPSTTREGKGAVVMKWKDNIYHTRSLKELEKLYKKLVKKGDYEAMEEMEFYVETGYFWVEKDETC